MNEFEKELILFIVIILLFTALYLVITGGIVR